MSSMGAFTTFLRDIKLGVTFLVLHHNKDRWSGVHSTKANVSEVWHLARNNILAPTQRLLDIEKSRSDALTVPAQLDVDSGSTKASLIRLPVRLAIAITHRASLL